MSTSSLISDRLVRLNIGAPNATDRSKWCDATAAVINECASSRHRRMTLGLLDEYRAIGANAQFNRFNEALLRLIVWQEGYEAAQADGESE